MSDAPPLVSVVMPARDAAPYLREAVDGVLAQTYPAWELLVVDDGSRDATRAIAESYAAAHPGRVRVLEHPGGANRGISASRNLGLRAARGSLVACVDADDVWLPHRLAAHVPIFAAHPEVDVVFGNVRYWHGWTGRADDAARDHVLAPGVPVDTVEAPPALLARYLRAEGPIPCPCAVLLRREALLRAGGQPEHLGNMHEDQSLYATLLLAGGGYVSGECVALYRLHTGSVIAAAKRTGSLRASERRYLDWLAAYAAARGVRDPGLLAALARAQRRNRYPRLTRARARAARVAARLRARVARLAGVRP